MFLTLNIYTDCLLLLCFAFGVCTRKIELDLTPFVFVKCEVLRLISTKCHWQLKSKFFKYTVLDILMAKPWLLYEYTFNLLCLFLGLESYLKCFISILFRYFWGSNLKDIRIHNNYCVSFLTSRPQSAVVREETQKSGDLCISGSNLTVGRGCRSFRWDRGPESK
jgi:hypothetical protein